MIDFTSPVMLPNDRLKVSCVKSWYRQRDSDSRPQTCKDCALPTELCRYITVSLYNYYILSVGSRTPFTVSVIRSLPLRAADAYYIMPQPFTRVAAHGNHHLYFTTRGLVGSFCKHTSKAR